MGIFVRVVATLFAVCSASQLEAAERSPSGCADQRSRQFDFWIGEWRVTENGKLAGHNRIERVLDGCALIENWTGAKGGSGKSLNFFDRGDGLWHQTWIDRSGGALFLKGSFADGAMRMEGERPATDKQPATRHRITWTALADGSVRQLWESSPVDRAAWSRQFDGLYIRAKATASANASAPKRPADVPRDGSALRICVPTRVSAISAGGMPRWLVLRPGEFRERRFPILRAGCATT